MAIKILIWNTQHLNNQKQAKPMSKAYADKKALLDSVIVRDAPDIIALFEVGNTGNPNATIVADLSGQYSLAGSLDQEGGATKNTTLGSMVFVKNELSGEFGEASFQTVLGAGHQRATITIVNKSNVHFSFYHANASYKAWGNIKEEIDYLQDQICQIGGALAFFGGDLNVKAHEAPDQVKDPLYHRIMERCTPEGPGYTHVSVRDSVTLAYEHYLSERENTAEQPIDKQLYVNSIMGTDIEYGVVASLSMLDFAYVAQGLKRRGVCPAAVIGRRVWNPVKGTQFDLLFRQHEVSNQVYEAVGKLYAGVKVRSDHFPVLYVLEA